MPERFVSLDAFVRVPAEPQPHPPLPSEPVRETNPSPAELVDAISDIRRFRAAVADAVDATIDALLRDISAAVLAREFELAPVDVRALVERVRARHADETVVAVRVHPEEIDQLSAFEAAVVADATLHRGDAVLQVCAGTIDLTLGTRLAAVLQARRT